MKANKTIPVLFIAFCVPCFANITMPFEFDALRDSAGTALTADTAFILLADSGGSGNLPTEEDVEGATLSVGSMMGTSTIFYTGLTAGSVASGTVTSFDFAAYNVAATNIWSILWFPGVAALGGTVTHGQSFGMFHSAVLDPVAQDYGADTAMVFPADSGQIATTQYYDSTTEPGSASSPSDFSANFTAIPEPSTLMLTVFASLGLLRRHRA